MKWVVGIVCVAVLFALGYGVWNFFHPAPVKQIEASEQKAATASTAAAAAGYALDANKIDTQRHDQERVIVVKQEAARAQILATPGADQPLSRALIDATNRGMCDTGPRADDPDCIRLRAGYHGGGPPAG